MLKAVAPDATPQDRTTGGAVGQSLATAGREDLVVYDLPAIFARKACQPLLRDGKPVDPVAYIAQGARDAPITMINEAHAEPRTRAFIAQVAEALRPLGYGGYAAETFYHDIGEKGPAVPLLSDGYYSQEPIYGRLLRRLRALDFRLLPYEARPGAEFDHRFESQAANLAAQMKRENAKLLVHAGQGNHREAANVDGSRPMGAAFAALTGIHPLTIEITGFEAAEASAVVCDPAAVADTPHRYDIRIGLPKLAFERSRPRWRLEAGDHFAEIPATLRRPDQIAVYEARPAGERGDSTPMDRVLLRPGETLPLLLPPGRYDVSAWTQKDGWSAVVPLTVAAN